MIFYFSSGQGSFEQTSRFIRPFLEFLFPDAPVELLNTYHGYIRKFTHFFVYAVLGFLASRAFRSASKTKFTSIWAPISVLLVAVVATLDELNQSFNDARSGSVLDVLLDVSGGIAAVCLVYWISRRREQAPRASNSVRSTN